MIVKNPYDQINRTNQDYTIPDHWVLKCAGSIKVKTLLANIKNVFGKEKCQSKQQIESLWKTAYKPFNKSMLQNPLVSNVLIALEDVRIYEYFGQRDALEECRHDALIKLSKGFDWRQFEPIKIANINGVLYCYDGGGRGHILHAAGFQSIPCSIVTLSNLSDLRVLFMEQKKLTKTISLSTKYVQAMAFIQDSIANAGISWWEDLSTEQKQWYNVFKLLQSSNLQVSGKDFAKLGGLRKTYASFVIANGHKSPTSRNKGDSDPDIECPCLVKALTVYRNFLVSNSLVEKMTISIACYLGQIIRKLYDPKNGVQIAHAAKIVNNTLVLAYNKYSKQQEHKTFAAFFSEQMGGMTGEQAWKNYDRKLGSLPSSEWSWFGRMVRKVISMHPCKIEQQTFLDALARNKHIK